MIEIDNFNVPTSWDEVTLEKYTQMFGGLLEDDNAETKTLKIVANILDISIEEALDLPAQIVGQVVGALKFISEPITDEQQATITLGHKTYKVLKLDEMSYRQYSNAEAEAKEPNNLVKFVANLLVDESGKYDVEDVSIIGGMLLKKPIKDVMCLVNYFSGLKNV